MARPCKSVAVISKNLTKEEFEKRKEAEEKLNATIDKNQTIIQDLAIKLNVIEEVKKDVQDIKERL